VNLGEMHKVLAANTTLSHYRILRKLGAGGMGEVYLAEDTRLDRKVAVKLLPAEFAADEDRVRRFEQEARATSALNHPNILTVYDIGTHDGAPFIVAELLEGEELRGRLNGGAIPQRKVIEYAQQIVAGLSAAHERGVIHRDLKPENIFITTDDRVKILDFGLAKLKPSALAAGSEDETRKPLTNPGVVMGTVGYMSPEQVRGAAADARSDIFSFGVILYEMLSGRRAFAGDSVVELLNAILKDDVAELDGGGARKVSPALDKIMRRCLEKRPEHRFRSAHDLCFALEALSSPTSSSGNSLTTTASVSVDEKTKTSVRRGWLAWAVAGALGLALLALGGLYFSNRSAPEPRAMRLSFYPPPELAFNDTQPDAAVISPDGQKIAFTATSADGKNMLYVRNLDSTEAKLLPGSENALEPFWSPDSRSIAYGSNGKLKRSDLTGAKAQVLCDSARMIGGTWSKDGIIVFAPDFRTTLVQVSAQGGEPKPVNMKTEGSDVERHRFPYFLPDDRHFLFFREEKGIWVGSLDSPEIKQIAADAGVSVYAPPGWLIFLRNDAVVAQAFDAGKLALTGEPIPIITGATIPPTVRRFSVSDNGVLVWQGQWQRDYQLVWHDRAGKQTGVIDAPMKVAVGQSPMLSPDGKRLVVRRFMSSNTAESNLWVVDLEKGTGLRITSTFSQMPVWSPDGSRIVYNSSNAGVTMKAANGSGDAETLLQRRAFPASWSPDGRFIFFMERGVKTRMDLWALPMFGDRKEYLLSNSQFDEQNPQLSPDGRWLAYTSDETGDYEIYVQSFSADGKLGADKKRVSTAGGKLPVWRRDGSELFFIAADGQMMASSVQTSGTEFQFAAPRPLFKTRTLALEGAIFREYDVSPDGQRFLIGTLVGDTKAQPPTVILNWPAELKR
jgi:serine/threonine protein kinase